MIWSSSNVSEGQIDEVSGTDIKNRPKRVWETEQNNNVKWYFIQLHKSEIEYLVSLATVILLFVI